VLIWAFCECAIEQGYREQAVASAPLLQPIARSRAANAGIQRQHHVPADTAFTYLPLILAHSKDKAFNAINPFEVLGLLLHPSLKINSTTCCSQLSPGVDSLVMRQIRLCSFGTLLKAIDIRVARHDQKVMHCHGRG
jgi:hypothetical protein